MVKISELAKRVGALLQRIDDESYRRYYADLETKYRKRLHAALTPEAVVFLDSLELKQSDPAFALQNRLVDRLNEKYGSTKVGFQRLANDLVGVLSEDAQGRRNPQLIMTVDSTKTEPVQVHTPLLPVGHSITIMNALGTAQEDTSPIGDKPGSLIRVQHTYLTPSGQSDTKSVFKLQRVEHGKAHFSEPRLFTISGSYLNVHFVGTAPRTH